MSFKEILSMVYRSHVDFWKSWRDPLFWLALTISSVLTYIILR